MSGPGTPDSAARPLVQKLQRIALYFFAATTVLLILWVIISGMITESRYATALLEREQESQMQIAARTRSLLQAVTDAMLPEIAQAFVVGDYGRLKQQVRALSSHADLHLMMIADREGQIRASTDIRLEGTQLPRSLELIVASSTAMIVDTVGDERYRVLAPVSSGGMRHGTLVVEFDFSAE